MVSVKRQEENYTVLNRYWSGDIYIYIYIYIMQILYHIVIEQEGEIIRCYEKGEWLKQFSDLLKGLQP